jgi:hypothetical protein
MYESVVRLCLDGIQGSVHGASASQKHDLDAFYYDMVDCSHVLYDLFVTQM